jgi:ribosomal protein S18 acetylase RimI-like enzyme
MIPSADIRITTTTRADLPQVLSLFDYAMSLQGGKGYKVWHAIDTRALEDDIQNGLQYKIVAEHEILCVFSVQYRDPFIWREKDDDNAIYLHRIVIDQKFKGQRLFGSVLQWAVHEATRRRLKFMRMDTWADNQKIIDYYRTFGFECIGYHKTPDVPELPVQNRNLEVALLQKQVKL